MQREVKRLWFVISILVVAPQSRCQPNLHLCGQDKWQTYRRRATGPARKLRQRLTKGLDHNPPTFKSSILHHGHLSRPASFMLCSFLFFFFFLFLRRPGRPGGPGEAQEGPDRHVLWRDWKQHQKASKWKLAAAGCDQAWQDWLQPPDEESGSGPRLWPSMIAHWERKKQDHVVICRESGKRRASVGFFWNKFRAKHHLGRREGGEWVKEYP